MVPAGLTELDTGLIVTLLGGGLISALVALRKVGPERAATVVSYQGDIIDDLNAERERLRKAISDLVAQRDELRRKQDELLEQNKELRERCDELAERVERLEDGAGASG